MKMKVELEEGELVEDNVEENEANVSIGSHASNKNLKKISGGVMQLNFMRKSYNQLVLAEKKTKKPVIETTKVYPTVLKADDEPVPGMDGIIRENRFTRLETLRFGRFSFHGQNPEIEKLTSGNPKKRPHEEEEETTEITQQPQIKTEQTDDEEFKQPFPKMRANNQRSNFNSKKRWSKRGR